MPKLTINAPKTGIAQSPLVGFADVRNIDVTSVAGIAMINNLQAKVSATTVVGQINWIVRHPITTAEVYALDNGGKVYRSGDSGATWALMTGNTQTSAHGNGLAIFKNYLIVARDGFLDVCGDGAVSGNGTTTGISNAGWTNGWQVIDSDVLWHPMIISKNDSKLYGGAGRFIFYLYEIKTFDPGTSASFTYTQQALDLPVNYRIKCLEEFGNDLMIGTWQGTNVTDIRVADIFPWDRSSITFGQPVPIDDFGVHAMKNNGNSIIVLAGISGTVRRCDGAQSYIIGQIPVSVADVRGSQYIEFYPGAIHLYKNRIFFGVGNSASGVGGMGVYSLNQTGQGNVLTFEHQLSNFDTTGNDGTSQILKASAILPISKNTILVGWRDNTTYGIDLTTATSYTTSYGAYFISPLYTVGTSKQPFKFGELEFSLVRPLRANEGVKIEYRTNLTDSFTTINTYNYATYGGVLSKNIITDKPTKIPDCEKIQIKVSLTGTTTSPEFETLSLQ
jgi:hypothetical protein